MPRLKNSFLRTFFDVRNDKQVMCKNEKCNKLLNVHAGNLERHLKTFHPSVYHSYLQKKGSNLANRSNNTTVRLSCSANKKHIQMALIELFTKCGRPLSLAEDRPFKIILNPMLEELKIKLSEQFIIENIAEFSGNLKKELSKELSERLISLKIDAATKSSKSLISVNVQFVKNNSVILKTLSIKQLSLQHTTEHLKNLILEVLAVYNLNLDQVITITIDSGTDTINNLNYDINSCSDATCVQDDLIDIDLDFSIDGISYIRSGASILQMCVLDVLASTGITEKLDNIRTIIKKLRSQFYLELLKIENCKMPLLDNGNRWTSTYQMLEIFLDLKSSVEAIKQYIASLEISNEIWAFANEFITVFKVAYTTSKKLQLKNCLYSDLYIEITNITLQLSNLPKSDLKFYFMESLNRQKLMLFENDLFVTAVFLDPRIKVCLASDQCARAKSCITQLYTRQLYLREGDTKTTKQTIEMYGSSTQTISSSISVTPSTAEDPLEEYFKAFDQVSSKNIFTTSQQIEQDILAYSSQSRLGIKENIIDFWSKQKNSLTEIAHLVLGIPCAQVSVEILSSALDYLQANQDNKYNPDILEHILLVKSNAEFIYD